MPKEFWKFVNIAPKKAQLALIGTIAEEKSWLGDEETPKDFYNQLQALGDVSEIEVLINSGGGDVFAAQAIGNMLEDHPAHVTARILGLCASAATVVACHCERVSAAADTSYMVHPVRVYTGYAQAEALRTAADEADALRGEIVSLYARKTGRTPEEVGAWMDKTSWWTAEQAQEKGFVDEVTGRESVRVENRDGVLFVNSAATGIPFAQAPEFVKKRLMPQSGGGVFLNKASEENGTGEETDMEIRNADELRAAYPSIVDEIERAAAKNAEDAERKRIRDIEEMAMRGSEALTQQAKFTAPMSAADYAVAAMKDAKSRGEAYLADAANDADAGGVNSAVSEAPQNATDEFLAAIRGTKAN